MFGLVNFWINRVLQNTRRGGGGGIGDSRYDANESDLDEATTEVISHTERLEALERALLYVEQHSKATPTDVIFYEALAGHCSLFSSFNTLSEENNRFYKKKDNL
jgi:hypothetical protein